ncbi:MAG: 4'-phosphopantetheinyl transferase superfamily protein [Pedosphaera sp.]|nr:4'-phosphopantetheinyl transferase superfamily protein [Pedosphaera sp.]
MKNQAEGGPRRTGRRFRFQFSVFLDVNSDESRVNAPGALADGEIHVWVFGLDAPPEKISALAATLSADERERAGQYRFGQLRERFTVGRGRLRAVLGGYLARAPADLEFGYTARGKPTLKDEGIHFNLAHSDDLALLAVTRVAPVGVDLERIRRMPDAVAIAKRFFARREVAALADLPAAAQDEGFFNLWTRKEAWLKATGDGITASLAKVEFTFRPGERARVVAIDGDAGAAAGWSLFTLQPAAGFVGALAIHATEVEVTQRKLKTES